MNWEKLPNLDWFKYFEEHKEAPDPGPEAGFYLVSNGVEIGIFKHGKFFGRPSAHLFFPGYRWTKKDRDAGWTHYINCPIYPPKT